MPDDYRVATVFFVLTRWSESPTIHNHDSSWTSSGADRSRRIAGCNYDPNMPFIVVMVYHGDNVINTSICDGVGC